MPVKKTVIYIEDNPTNLKLVEQLIKRKGELEFLSATEPQKGIELIRTQQPDLILLDINLPEMNGFEILEILRKQSNTASIPVIAVSANAMPSDLEKGLAAGFNAYITKPINISDFYNQVEQFLA